jgi:hypothetical protein
MTATFIPTAWRTWHKSSGAGEWSQLLLSLYSGSNYQILHTTTAALSSTSTTYVDVSNTSFSVNKMLVSTKSDLGFLLMVHANRATAGTSTTYGISTNGTDNDNHKMTYTTALKCMFSSGVNVVTGLGAGSVAVKVRAKGSAANTMTITAGDTLCLLWFEVQK